MSRKEALLAADLLELAAEEFGCHGCNDVPPSLVSRFNADELEQLTSECLALRPGYGAMYDDILMRFLAHKLREAAEEDPRTEVKI